MEEQSHFDFPEWESDDPEVEDGIESMERVSSRIEWAIIRFCKEHATFHADELRQAVIRATGIAAPASADRILRLLRQKRRVIYEVVSRRESLYRVISVRSGDDGKTSDGGSEVSVRPG